MYMCTQFSFNFLIMWENLNARYVYRYSCLNGSVILHIFTFQRDRWQTIPHILGSCLEVYQESLFRILISECLGLKKGVCHF